VSSTQTRDEVGGSAAPPDARLPRGGVRSSGIGRELGWAGIEASTEEKTVTITL
jgi:phenylacetaldehyde dehydrogenase